MIDVIKNNMIEHLQVGYMPDPNLNHNKAFKDQVERSTISTFDLKKCYTLKTFQKIKNTRALALIICLWEQKYNNIQGVRISYLLNNLQIWCVDYLCLQQVLLSLVHKVFGKTIFNNISGIIIPEVLYNIMSCHGFLK